MRDYKKIYDELFDKVIKAEKTDYITHLLYEDNHYTEWLFGKYTEIDKSRKAELTTLLHNLYEDTPQDEVLNLFSYIIDQSNSEYDDICGWVFNGFNIPDEQIEAVCKEYACFEWWAKTICCLLLCEHKDKPLSTIYQVYFDNRIVEGIMSLFDYYQKNIIPKKVLSELSNTPYQEPQTPILPNLPTELNTPKAMKYWEKAQEAGLIDSNYNWLKSKVLLACFAEEMSKKLDLGKGYNSNTDSKRINWKIFENLITLKGYNQKPLNLRGSLNDLKKTGVSPSDINLVNDVFK